MKTYSTKEAATLVGVHRVTLQHWVSSGKVRPSQYVGMNGLKYWRWTDRDIERVRKYKEKNYRKGRGPKPKANKR